MIFVDFHGTLCHDLFWRSLPKGVNHRLANFLFDENLPLVTSWMRGEVSSETINAQIAEAIEVPYDTLWNAFKRDCETMFVEPETLELLGQLRQDAVVLLVTDNMDCFTRFTVPALGLERYFDAIVNSSDTGRLKADRNGAIFQDLAADWEIPIARCALFDDSEDACATIGAMGGKSVRIADPQHLYGTLQTLPGQL